MMAQALGVNVDELEVRVASETSARLPTPFEDEQVGVKKRNRGKQPNRKQRQNERKAKEAGQERPGARR